MRSLYQFEPRLERIQNGERSDCRDPHRMSPADAAKGYEIFVNTEDNCEKVVLKA